MTPRYNDVTGLVDNSAVLPWQSTVPQTGSVLAGSLMNYGQPAANNSRFGSPLPWYDPTSPTMLAGTLMDPTGWPTGVDLRSNRDPFRNQAFYDMPGSSARTGGSATTPGAGDYVNSAVSSNIGSVGKIGELSDLINQISQRAQQSANYNRIPGGAALEQASSQNIGNAMAGTLPDSVINQIAQRAAERGVGSGSPMGASANSDYLRSLGLTSLDLMNTGQNWLTGAVGRNPGAPIFNPASMMLTPEQVASIDLANKRFALEKQNAGRVIPPSGGGGGFIGGGGGNRTSPGLGLNFSDLFLPSTGTYSSTSPTGSGYNWFDQLLFDEAGSNPTFDYNWSDFGNYV